MAMPVISHRAVILILYSPNHHHHQVRLLLKFVDVFLFHRLLVSREPSPYRPPVETNNIAITPNKPSPTRRRLPPTPGTSSSPFATMAMPEPHPFQPPDMPVAKAYPSHPSAISFESVQRKTEDSPNSHGGRRLPPEPGYANGSNTWSDGNKTSISSMDYQSQVSVASNTSYTSSNSLGSRKNVSGDAHVRPPGASPPVLPPVLPPKPITYPEDVKDMRNPFQSSYNAYEYGLEAANGYSPSKTVSSNPYDMDIPPPPPPKLASSLNLPYPDPSSQYANVIQTSPRGFLSNIRLNNS